METMSENIFSDELDSCAKHVFSCHQESKKLETNNKACTDFNGNISFENGHYSAKLSFKEICGVLPDNYQLAVKRFNYLKRRLLLEK